MKLTHPESETPRVTVEVEPDKAEPYLSQGWVERPAPAKKD